MSDALEQVRAYLGRYDWAADTRTVQGIGDDDECLTFGDLRAVCAELTALRGARSWERWAIVDDGLPAYVYVTIAALSRMEVERGANPGERVIRVRITEIPEDGQ